MDKMFNFFVNCVEWLFWTVYVGFVRFCYGPAQLTDSLLNMLRLGFCIKSQYTLAMSLELARARMKRGASFTA